ncbi:DUF116 domain-containing protein [Anoxynatronum sibiricum]|uniref:DUF116 domain-containing protein n=1 Tax=Anoxynatronum sibiricum TaxID=210623 RepID=A0ABU9VR06_9CLOT
MNRMTNQEQKSLKKTMILLLLLLVALATAIGIFVWIMAEETLLGYRLIGVALLAILVMLCFIALSGMVAFRRLWYNKPIPNWMFSMSYFFLRWLYPTLIHMSLWFNIDKDDIRRAYTRLNNQALLNHHKCYNVDEILILTPHCLQQAACGIKITNNITQCTECGACNISGLLDLQRRYQVEVVVVTGGTLARKRIQNKKPALVIAIACERDLMSGLMDVRQIPVFALTNERPEGPCHNTRVNLLEVEQALKRFIKR